MSALIPVAERPSQHVAVRQQSPSMVAIPNSGVVNLLAGEYTLDITPPYSPDYEAAIVIHAGHVLVIEGAGRESTTLRVVPEDLTGVGPTRLFYVRPGGTLILRNLKVQGHDYLGNTVPHDGTTGYVINRCVELGGGARLEMDNVWLTKWGEPIKSTYDTFPNASLYDAWMPSTTYEPSRRVVASGNVYECKYGGESSAAGVGPDSVGGEEIRDGTAYWLFIATASDFQLGSTVLLNNCFMNNRGAILCGQGTHPSSWDETSSVFHAVGTRFEHLPDHLDTAGNGTGLGHQLYIGPGVNLYIDGCDFLNCGQSCRAIQVNDSAGYDCKARYCQILNSRFLRQCSSQVENNQYIDTVIAGCYFEYYSTGVSLRASPGTVYISNCAFHDLGVGGAAIANGGSADVSLVVEQCVFHGEVPPVANSILHSFIKLNGYDPAANYVRPWLFRNCTFGRHAQATSPAAFSQVSKVETNQIFFEACTFNGSLETGCVFSNGGTLSFKSCRFYGSSPILVYPHDISNEETGDVEVTLNGCIAHDDNKMLVIPVPSGRTVTVRGGGNRWPPGIGPDVADSARVRGSLQIPMETGPALASATTVIWPINCSVAHVTGTTTIETIHLLGMQAPTRIFAGPIMLIADAPFALGSTGNILPRHNNPRSVHEAITLYYDSGSTTWYEY